MRREFRFNHVERAAVHLKSNITVKTVSRERLENFQCEEYARLWRLAWSPLLLNYRDVVGCQNDCLNEERA